MDEEPVCLELAEREEDEASLAVFVSPQDEPGLADRIVPLRRKGPRMPGRFKYTPAELMDMLRRYSDFMQDRKLYRKEMLKGGPMAGSTVDIDMQAPMSLESFWLYCYMFPSTWRSYRKRPEYRDVVEFIEATIMTNNYEMAAVGLIHAGLVARKHGLVDRTDVQSGGQTIDVVPINFSFTKKTLEGRLTKELDKFDDLK